MVANNKEDISSTNDNINKAMEDMSLQTTKESTQHPLSHHTPYDPSNYHYQNRYFSRILSHNMLVVSYRFDKLLSGRFVPPPRTSCKEEDISSFKLEYLEKAYGFA